MLIASRILAVGLVLAIPAGRAAAPQVQDMQPPLEVLDEVLVTGTQPGPALWRVKSAANELWVLALPPLVSKDIKWRSKQVEKVLAGAQEVLAQYGTVFIPKSAIPPELLDRKNIVELVNQTRYLPEGQTLRDVLPSDVYASFETAVAAFPVFCLRQLEKRRDLEHFRPEWARNLLGSCATRALKLGDVPVLDKVVGMARRRGIKITSVEYLSATGYFRPFPESVEAAMDMCPLDALLQGLEGRGARWKARANAWAIGDVQRLKELVRPLPSRIPQCAGREARGAASKQKWLAAMERSLAGNRSTLAVVDASLLLSADGLLDTLRSRGYEVVDP